MIEQLQNLAQSPNVALLLSLIANVVMGLTIVRLFRKLEESVSAKEQLLMKILRGHVTGEKYDGRNQTPVAPPGL